MRLWHQDLIPKLPRQQLLGQWRECIALLGNGWGKQHKTVNYVFTYNETRLVKYSRLICSEMQERGYKPNITKILNALQKRMSSDEARNIIIKSNENTQEQCYTEHNEEYLQECIANLKNKGVII